MVEKTKTLHVIDRLLTLLFAPFKANTLFFVTMYLLGVVGEWLTLPNIKGIHLYGNLYLELFIDIYVVCALLMLLPGKVRMWVRRLIYIIVYSVAIVDIYCFWKFRSTITPTMLLLVDETDSREAGEFLRSYLSPEVVFSPVGGVFLLIGVHALAVWKRHWLKQRLLPVAEKYAFAHESGIHVHGILNNSLTYEPISPEVVGHSRRIVIGKHTGANALKSKLEQFNIDLNDEQFKKVFGQIKDLGDKGKTITDSDLKAIAITEISSARETPIKLLGLGLLSGATVSPTATVKLEIDGEVREVSATGVGPIDAALNSIKKLISGSMDIELEEYNLEAITGGTDALAEVFTITSDSNGNKSTGRATHDDVIMASILAVLDSINKLLLIQRSS